MNRFLFLIIVLGSALLLAGGCVEDSGPMQLADLSADEQVYLTRFIQLERARAVTLVQRELGEALLDSLAVAWGDSSLVELGTAFGSDTARAAGLHDLLGRILEAEEDSLLQVPLPRRLTEPLPDPLPKVDP